MLFGEVTQEELNNPMRSFQERPNWIVQSNGAQMKLKFK